jgi:hypothetical protein
MHKDAKWMIDGTLKTQGTQDEPVIFRADRLNNFSQTLSYDNISAQWDGLYYGATSFDNELNYTQIRNGISGIMCEESTPDRKKIDIRNSQIKNMDGNVLYAHNCYIEASNTEFSNASNSLICLWGGKYRFTHCTMANYMQSAMMSHNARFQPTLTLIESLTFFNNDNKDELSFPLQQAFFDNCIIDGNLSPDTTKNYRGEIAFYTDDAFMDGDDEHFNYRFNHCVIKTKKVDNKRFNEVLFIENTKVENTNYIKSTAENEDKEYNYIYDFRLASESMGIGKADRNISELFPVDRYGVNRLAGEFGPSIGAYEYVANEK